MLFLVIFYLQFRFIEDLKTSGLSAAQKGQLLEAANILVLYGYSVYFLLRKLVFLLKKYCMHLPRSCKQHQSIVCYYSCCSDVQCSYD